MTYSVTSKRTHHLPAHELTRIDQIRMKRGVAEFAARMAIRCGFENDLDYLSALLSRAIRQVMIETKYDAGDGANAIFTHHSCVERDDLDDGIPF